MRSLIMFLEAAGFAVTGNGARQILVFFTSLTADIADGIKLFHRRRQVSLAPRWPGCKAKARA